MMEELAIPEYELEEHNILNNHGRGMIMYIHKSINYRIIETGHSFEESINIAVGNLIIGAFYRSPNSSIENATALVRTIACLSSVYPTATLLCVGDFNYPTIDWTTVSAPGNLENKGNIFLETLKDCFLTQKVTEPTRRRGLKRANTLNLVITNEPDAVLSISMESGLGKSDHGMTIVTTTGQFRIDNATRKYLNYNRGNYDELREHLTRDWTRDLATLPSVQQKWDYVASEYHKAVEWFIPEQTVRPWKKYKRPLSAQIRKKIKKKNKLWKKYMKSNNEQIFMDYKKLRNQVRRATRKEEKQKEKDIVDNVKTNANLAKEILVLCK